MEKKKTFEELFAGTRIEPTTNENGGVDYNFNATLTTQSKPQSEFVYVSTSHPSAIVNISTDYQNLSEKEKSELLSKLFEWIANKKAEIKPVKLYTEQQVIMAMHLTNTYKENYNQVLEQLTPIELPSDEEINEKANSLQDEKDGDLYNEGINEGFYLGVEYMQQQILNQKK
jgi:hypothetical protein